MKKTPLRSPLKADSSHLAESNPQAMIQLHGVVKRFSNAAGEFTVLKGVDLTINRGEFVSTTPVTVRLLLEAWIFTQASPKAKGQNGAEKIWASSFNFFSYCPC
jgi:hypothetical protein